MTALFYDIFLALCKKTGQKPTPAALEAGIGRSTASYWKAKWKEGVEVLPSNENARLLAEHFGVSVGFLLGQEAALPAPCQPKSQVRKMVDDRLDQMDEETLYALLKVLEA